MHVRLILRIALVLLFAGGGGYAAEAALLNCTPEAGRLQVRIDGFGRGDRIPGGLETFTAFIRAGADEYEMFTEDMRASTMQEEVLRIEAERALSAGEAAQLSFEGKAAANGEDFIARVTFRAEGRLLHGEMRCRLI